MSEEHNPPTVTMTITIKAPDGTEETFYVQSVPSPPEKYKAVVPEMLSRAREFYKSKYPDETKRTVWVS